MASVEQRAPARRLRSRGTSRRSMTDERREELLAQLEQIFLAEGFRDLSVDDIAGRLHCSKSTLYSLASSKEQLVTATIKRFYRDAVGRIEARVAAAHDPRERIAVYLTAIGEEMDRRSTLCYEDMRSFEATDELYRSNGRASARRIRELIHEGVEAGAFREVHGEFVAAAVALLIEGIVTGRLLDSTGLSSQQAWKELSAFALSALTNEG